MYYHFIQVIKEKTEQFKSNILHFLAAFILTASGDIRKSSEAFILQSKWQKMRKDVIMRNLFLNLPLNHHHCSQHHVHGHPKNTKQCLSFSEREREREREK